MREAAKLGFELGLGPEDAAEIPSNFRYIGLDRLPKLVDRVMAAA
jgi:DNA repair protein RadA/Sms